MIRIVPQTYKIGTSAPINIKDIGLIGFIYDNNNETLRMYYLLNIGDCEGDNIIAVQYFKMEDMDEDIKYLNSPLNLPLNIPKFTKYREEAAINTIYNFEKKEEVYFCDFMVKDNDTTLTNTSSVTCTAIQYNKYGMPNSYVDFIIPFYIFYKIETISSELFLKLPLNSFIDRDNSYKDADIVIVDKVETLGIDKEQSYNTRAQYHIMFVLYNKDNKIGFETNLQLKHDSFAKKLYDKNNFNLFYKDNFYEDISRFTFSKMKIHDELENVLCIMRRENGKATIYILDSEKSNSILNPYKDLII